MTIPQLVTNGRSYDELESNEKAAFNTGGRYFTQAERDWFETNWLLATQSQVDAINAALTTANVAGLKKIVDDGSRYVVSSCLTDCHADETYVEAADLLRALPIVSWVYEEPEIPV